MITREQMARCIHEWNRAYNVALNDPAPDPPYDALLPGHRAFLLARVTSIMNGSQPREIHADWVDEMTQAGWRCGESKNPTGTPPTHPCLKDWTLLPPVQQVKDVMAVDIVQNLMAVNEQEERRAAADEITRLGEESGA